MSLHKKTFRFSIVKRKDGKFLRVNRDTWTTAVYWVDNAIDACRVEAEPPYHPVADYFPSDWEDRFGCSGLSLEEILWLKSPYSYLLGHPDHKLGDMDPQTGKLKTNRLFGDCILVPCSEEVKLTVLDY